MKVKQVVKKALSVLLSVSMLAGMVPMTAFAEVPTTDLATTQANVALIKAYAEQMREANVRTDYADVSSNKLTWDTEGKKDTWRYFNGVMTDAYMMLGSEEDVSFVKNFYDLGNIDENGNITNYAPNQLDSVPMGLALFDLLKLAKEDTSTATFNVSDVTITDASSSYATVEDDTITFSWPVNCTEGYGVAVENPFVGTDTTAGTSVSFWLTPQDVTASVAPLITFVNTSNSTTTTSTSTDADGNEVVTETTLVRPQVLRFDVNGAREFVDHFNGANVRYATNNISSNTMENGTEYFVTFVFNEKSLQFYVNGVEVATAENVSISDSNGTLDILSFLNNSETKMYVGGLQIPYDDTTAYAADNINADYRHNLSYGTVVADLNAYNTALTADEIKAIYDNGGVVEQGNATDIARYTTAINYIYNQLEEQITYDSCGGNYLHKQEINDAGEKVPTSGWSTYNIGLDGIYMAQPFLLEYANALESGLITNENVTAEQIYEEVNTRLNWIADNMYDEETGRLYHHGWSVDNNEGSGHFWARGIGWYAVALADAIGMMPSSYRSNLVKKLRRVCDGMMKWQDANTGMWNNVVNREEALTGEYSYKDADGNTVTGINTNKLETSGTAMMAYAMMKAYNNEWVDEKYGLAGLKAFNGIVENKVTGTVDSTITVNDVYKQSGVEATDELYLKHPFVANEAKGIGLLIMASTLAETTATKLATTSDDVVTESFSDVESGVSVSGSGATALTVADASTYEVVINAAETLVEEGYSAYDVNLTDQKVAATISIPLPVGANADEVVVYEIDDNGAVTEVTGTVDGDNFIFRTLTPANYIIGVEAVQWDEFDWTDISGSSEDTYTLVQSMSASSNGYLIANQDIVVDGDMYSLGWADDGTNHQTITVQLSQNSNGEYMFSGVDKHNLWYIDSEGYIYSENGDTTYYLMVTGSAKAVKVATTKEASGTTWTVSPKDSSYVNITMVSDVYSGGFKYDGSKAAGEHFRTGTAGRITLWERTPAQSLNGEIALEGVTNYSMYVNGGTVTEDIIKANAEVWFRENAEAEPTEISWDDLTYAWTSTNGKTTFDPSTAGTYTMTVKYSGVAIGEITVEVKDLPTTAVDSEVYYAVQEMVPGNEYVITLSDWGFHVSVDDSTGTLTMGAGELLTITEDETDNGAYKIATVDDYNTWYIDDSGRIYCVVNSTPYYLVGDGSEKTVTITDVVEDASTWTVNVGNADEVSTIALNDASNRYLKIDGNGTKIGVGGTAYINLKIFAKDPITSVALTGTTTYSINKNDSTVTEASILENATLYALTGDGSIPTIIDWDDPYVAYSWDKALDTATTGTYTMTVTYGEDVIGTVTVTVNDPVWVDMPDTPESFTAVQTITEIDPDGYVIADNNSSNGDTYTLYLSDDSFESSTKKVTMSNYTKGANNSRNCSLSGVNNDNTWFFEDNGSGSYYIYMNKDVDGVATPYYLLTDGTVVSATNVKDNASVWSVERNTGNWQSSFLYTTVDGSKKYLSVLSSGLSVSGSSTYITIWAKTPAVDNGQATLDGTTNYTINQGDTLTLDEIKSNAKILLRDNENDTEYEELPWDNENVVCIWDKEYDTETPGTYTLTVSYEGTDIGTITVTVKEHVAVQKVLTGNEIDIDTAVGREPNFGNIKYTITYNDGSVEELTVGNGLTVSGYDVNTAGIYQGAIYYDGVVIGYVTINVDEDPYHGLEAAPSPYPEYPEEGAVRINKTATNNEFSFNNSGVAKVELDVAGISTNNGVDVVLVVDVSNSMGWSDNWFEQEGIDADTATESDKVPRTTDASPTADPALTTDKLDQAMEAASSFASILMEDNVTVGSEGAENNNSFSFVTFAGYDADNIKDVDANRVDSVQTVFTNVQDATTAGNVFSNTKFIDYDFGDGSGGVTYTLQIGDETVTGTNRGNTNYDYAFAEAQNAVRQLQSNYTNYEATGRKTIVVFMTDGAATHYNDQRANGGASDRLYGTTVQYPDKGTYTSGGNTVNNWTKFISNPNRYAQELNEMADAFYAIGFDLNHGGFGSAGEKMSWSEGELLPVLYNLAGKDYTGAYNVDDVVSVLDGAQLISFYSELASSLKYSGANAKVTDVIKDDFTLHMGTQFQTVEQIDSSGNLDEEASYQVITDASGKAITPTIQIISYELYTKEDVLNKTTYTKEDGTEAVVDSSMIGERTGNCTVLETVTFNAAADGYTSTEAYSSEIDNSTTNIMTTGTDGSITITGKYFTYTKDVDGVETFVWSVGDITDDEVTFTYYAYLKGAKDIATSPADGIYDTNEEAVLEYITNDGYYATQEFPVPQRNWGTAMTSVEYYLVNSEGNPVNWAGVEIPFADRIIVSNNNYTQQFRWGDTLTVYGAESVPTGYTMYNSSAYYTVTANSDTDGELVISDGAYPPTTYRVDTDLNNIGSTRVAFAVVLGDEGMKVSWNLGIDQIVVDYGKAIDEDVLANNTQIASNGYSAEVVGLAQYSSDSKYIEYTQSSPGVTEPMETYNGIFSLVGDGRTVRFTPTKIMSQVQKIFTVVKITDNANTSNFYYLYQPLYVIPATNIYYETDFATGVFTTTQSDGTAWGTETDSNKKDDQIQDDGTIGQDDHTYGYDSTYTDDAMNSDGSSYVVNGEGVTKTTSTFTFTGTGFELISRTGADHGTIRVRVYDAKTGERVKSVSVLNKSESTWGELYQIPVLSIDLSAYGTYNVEIGVFDEYLFPGTTSYDEHAMSRGNLFYFDAIRVHNPAGVEGLTDELLVANYAEALAAYKTDGEAYPTKYEVRDLLISAGDFDLDSSTTGVIYIDQPENGTDTNKYVSVGDYDEIGPNNEVYLAQGKSIAFKLSGINPSAIASIDVGVKNPDGKGAIMSATVAGDANKTDYIDLNNVSITSSTEQFIDLAKGITAADTSSAAAFKTIATSGDVAGDAFVFITNTGAGVLSITDIKIAYDNDPLTTAFVSVVTEEVLDYASACLYAEPSYDVTSASFAAANASVFYSETLTVETSQDVVELEITNNAGLPVYADVSYEDGMNGVRVWTIEVQMLMLGEQTFTITGYCEDGTAGASMEATVNVEYKKGGLLQNAKDVWKTSYLY